MICVGVKELKAKLIGYVNRLTGSKRTLTKDPAEEVAVVAPLSSAYRTMQQLVKLGKAQWAFGKPEGLSPKVTLQGGALSSTVLKERE